MGLSGKKAMLYFDAKYTPKTMKLRGGKLPPFEPPKREGKLPDNWASKILN